MRRSTSSDTSYNQSRQLGWFDAFLLLLTHLALPLMESFPRSEKLALDVHPENFDTHNAQQLSLFPIH